MSHDVHPNTLRAFVLDQLEEDARASLEASALDDDELFAHLRETEDDLIDAYVRGTLDTATHDRVASTLLAGPNGQARLAVAEGLHRRTNASSTDQVPKTTATAFGSLGRLALAAAVLLALFAGWLGLRVTQLSTDLEQREQERIALATERDKWTQERAALDNAIGATEQRANKLAEQVEARAAELESLGERLRAAMERPGRVATRAPLTVALALSLGVRGDAPPTLAVPKDAAKVRLQVELEEDGVFDHYRAVLTGARGVQTWATGDLSADETPWGAQLTLELPEGIFAAGPHTLTLQGRTADGTAEDVGFYSFTVTRR